FEAVELERARRVGVDRVAHDAEPDGRVAVGRHGDVRHPLERAALDEAMVAEAHVEDRPPTEVVLVPLLRAREDEARLARRDPHHGVAAGAHPRGRVLEMWPAVATNDRTDDAHRRGAYSAT